MTLLFLLKLVKTVMEKTSSGGFCSNDGIIHMALPGLPFGGVGMCQSSIKQEEMCRTLKGLGVERGAVCTETVMLNLKQLFNKQEFGLDVMVAARVH